MGIKKMDIKPMQRVQYGEYEVTVLEVKPRGVVIRNQFGYRETVKPSELRALSA